MELRDRLDLFQGMVQCCHNLYLWEYDRELALVRSNCPYEDVVRRLFSLDGGREFLLSYAVKHRKPVIMTNALGIMWAVIPERHGDELRHIHILGPFFMEDRASQGLEKRLGSLDLPPSSLREMRAALRGLPVISLSRVFEYTIMLFYCITGEKIPVSDLHYRESAHVRPADREKRKADIHGTYEMEQEMLRMVREGDLNIQSHMDRLALSGSMLMSGYWHAPELTEKALVRGMLLTNDVVYVDEDGYVHMLGRSDDIINVGGEKVSPLDVENVACEFTKLRECACIGVPDTETHLGEVPVLFYATDDETLDPSEIKAYIAANTEKYKVPVHYVRVGALPRNRMQKLDRRALRAMWEERA